ncbi:MAG: hypothetical protein GY696_02790, partial [Gammaproteobacteria bacterium]|nr:hypothetical protein [Gammaproteobacteria bacterium]
MIPADQNIYSRRLVDHLSDHLPVTTGIPGFFNRPGTIADNMAQGSGEAGQCHKIVGGRTMSFCAGQNNVEVQHSGPNSQGLQVVLPHVSQSLSKGVRSIDASNCLSPSGEDQAHSKSPKSRKVEFVQGQAADKQLRQECRQEKPVFCDDQVASLPSSIHQHQIYVLPVKSGTSGSSSQSTDVAGPEAVRPDEVRANAGTEHCTGITDGPMLSHDDQTRTQMKPLALFGGSSLIEERTVDASESAETRRHKRTQDTRPISNYLKDQRRDAQIYRPKGTPEPAKEVPPCVESLSQAKPRSLYRPGYGALARQSKFVTVQAYPDTASCSSLHDCPRVKRGEGEPIDPGIPGSRMNQPTARLTRLGATERARK